MPKAKLVTRTRTTSNVTTDNLNKGAALEFSELDSNLINLRDQTFGVVADDSATIQVGADSVLYIQGGQNVTTSTTSDGVIKIDVAGDGNSLGNISGTGDTLSSSGSTINFDDPVQISIAGSTGTDIGNIARFGQSSNLDFNHQGSLTGVFAVYGDDAQTATGGRPFTINLDGVHEGCEVGLATYNSSQVPTTYTPGLLISITDNGYKPAYYDGSNWRYVHDNSTV